MFATKTLQVALIELERCEAAYKQAKSDWGPRGRVGDPKHQVMVARRNEYEAAMEVVVSLDGSQGLVAELTTSGQLAAEYEALLAPQKTYLTALLKELRLERLQPGHTVRGNWQQALDRWEHAVTFEDRAWAWKRAQEIADCMKWISEWRGRYTREADFHEALKANWRFQKFAGWHLGFGTYSLALEEALEKARAQSDQVDESVVAGAVASMLCRLVRTRAEWLNEEMQTAARSLLTGGPRAIEQALSQLPSELGRSLSSYLAITVQMA